MDKEQAWQQRLALHNAPSWDDMPGDCDRRVMQKSGVWYWIEKGAEVRLENDGWHVYGNHPEAMAYHFVKDENGQSQRSDYFHQYPDFWKISLESRPGNKVEIGGSVTATAEAAEDAAFEDSGPVVDAEFDESLHNSEAIPRDEYSNLLKNVQHYADEAEMLQVKLNALRASVAHVCWKLGEPGYGDVADEVRASLQYALDEFECKS